MSALQAAWLALGEQQRRHTGDLARAIGALAQALGAQGVAPSLDATSSVDAVRAWEGWYEQARHTVAMPSLDTWLSSAEPAAGTASWADIEADAEPAVARAARQLDAAYAALRGDAGIVGAVRDGAARAWLRGRVARDRAIGVPGQPQRGSSDWQALALLALLAMMGGGRRRR